MDISLGIITHRDGKRLGQLLESIRGQLLETVGIREIIVVTPDNMGGLTNAWETGDGMPKLTVLQEGKREGKYAAINKFLDKATSETLLICSGDIYLDAKAIETICQPFANEEVGVVTCRPIPTRGGRLSDTAKLLWDIHDLLSQHTPKFTELIAFRNTGFRLLPTAVDDEAIGATLLREGYVGHYSRDATVYNQGSSNIKDFVKQRRRIYCGHLQLLRSNGHRPRSLDVLAVLGASLRAKSANPKSLLVSAVLEGTARMLGFFDYLVGRDYSIWDPIRKD